MICLFEDGQASLLLRDVKYGEDGNLKSAWVVNGVWRLVIKNGEFLAKDERFIVTRRPMPNYEIIEIPSDVKGGYTKVMDWAQRQFDNGKY